MSRLYDEDGGYWIAGYQDAEGEYHNLQDDSGAVYYDKGEVDGPDWERFEVFDDRNRDRIADELQDADHVTVAWIDDNNEVNYATVVDGIDLDYWDFEEWISNYE